MANYIDTIAGDDPEEMEGMEGMEGDDEEVLAGLMGEELGARRRRRVAALIKATGVKRMPTRQLIPQVTGVPQRGLRKTWLPIGAIAFTASSGTALSLTASAQRPFRGTRLVFDFARTGASATGLLTLTELKCGQDAQPAAAGAAPLAAFGPTAFDVDIDLDPIGPGVAFVASVAISAAPTASDRVDVSGVLFGYQVK